MRPWKRDRHLYPRDGQRFDPPLSRPQLLEIACDGDGLFFRSFGAGKAYWVYRYRHGRDREMSLGPYPEVSLSDARAKHAAARKQVVSDKADPLAARDAERAKRKGSSTSYLASR